MGELLVVTPNEFDGTDVERINQAIDAAAKRGCRVVIPRINVHGEQRRDVWLIDSAILLRSHTTLELDNCRIKLSDRCRDNLIRSANCGLGITDIRPMQNIHIRGIGAVVLEGADHPRATGDSGKTLGQGPTAPTPATRGEPDWRLAEYRHPPGVGRGLQHPERRDPGFPLLGDFAGTMCPRHAAGYRFAPPLKA